MKIHHKTKRGLNTLKFCFLGEIENRRHNNSILLLLPTLYLRQNLICLPASRPFISKETVEHTSKCELLLKIYHFPSICKSLSSTKCAPTLSANLRTNHIRSRLAFTRTSRKTYFRLRANL